MATKELKTAIKLFEAAFSNARSPRSDEYRAGVLALLKRQIEGVDFACPYGAGTAASDAFYAEKGIVHTMEPKGETI